jgi:large subunit ribosomal protein L18
MKQLALKLAQAARRKMGIRKRVSGTQERPRLTVFRSNLNIYAQIIDDIAGKTLVSASSRDKGVELGYGGNKSAAAKVGGTLAEKAIQAGIKKVVFDRNGYAYHGRIKELADAARKAGLDF